MKKNGKNHRIMGKIRKNIFYLDSSRLRFTNEMKHIINTGDSKPLFTHHKIEGKTQVWKMLQGIIKPLINSPIWIVPKKINASGKQKCLIVIDYIKII